MAGAPLPPLPALVECFSWLHGGYRLWHLKEEGVLEETRAVVLKETLAWQVQQAMAKEKISKVEMARRMNTSRAALDRLLDPGNASVTLQILTRAAQAVAPICGSNWFDAGDWP